MTERRRVSVETEIDRGFSYARWLELRGAEKKCFAEQMRFAALERDPSFLRVDYSILKGLESGDSVYIPSRYGLPESRAAAFNIANRMGWHIITAKSYEGGSIGLRVFRL